MSSIEVNSEFAALAGVERPFSWQSRLIDNLIGGTIPMRCAIPTGLGKTNTIAAWLVALGRTIKDESLTVPRRLVYVVDRRTVVDQATIEVTRMRKRLLDSVDDSPLGSLRLILQRASAAPEKRGFSISTLRGQFADNHEWDQDASRPAVIIGTVDMIGSRLFFSGYGGLGRNRRSLHAGLLSQDALIIVDEAHLSRAFAESLISLREHLRRKSSIRPFDLLLLTATQPMLRTESYLGNTSDEIRIDQDDLAFGEVARRFRAKKTLHIIEPEESAEGSTAKLVGELIAKRMASEAVRLAGKSRAVVIFANTVDLVNRIRAALKTHPHEIDESQLLTLTGEMRGKERDKFAESETFQLFQTRHRDRGVLKGPVFLITTAAGEVGVNFDADDAVCDLVPLDRMAQRLGRVNRFGDDSARVSIVLPIPLNSLRAHVEELERLIALSHKTESDERRRTEKRISELEKTLPRQAGRTLLLLERLPPSGGSDERIDCSYFASPEALTKICLEPSSAEAFCSSSPPPPIDPARLDDWALTSLQQADFSRPQVSYWLRGVTPDDTVTTQLAWREDLCFAVDLADAVSMAQVIPLSPTELAQVATHRASKLLVELAKEYPESLMALLTPAGKWTARPLSDLIAKNQDPEQLISYATIILPAQVGGLTREGLPDRAGASPVSDEVDRKRFLRFRISRTAEGAWAAQDLFADEEADVLADGHTPEEVCRELANRHRGRFRRIQISGSTGEPSASHPRVAYFVQCGVQLEAAGTADLASLQHNDVTVSAHNKTAEKYARLLVDRLKLEKILAEAVVLAAARHDLGKDRPQWQRAIRNAGPEPLAKSTNPGFDRTANGGYRHEFGSMLEAADDPLIQTHPERELILHLIAAHHGHARPGFPEAAYDCPRRLLRECAGAAQEAEERYVRLQLRFGWWQLAYLEALVKSADALASTNPESNNALP